MLKNLSDKDQRIVKNAFLNGFIDAYMNEHFNIILGHIFVNKRNIRIVNTHMKLTRRSFLEELRKFAKEFQEKDIAYDFVLDAYEDFYKDFDEKGENSYWNFK